MTNLINQTKSMAVKGPGLKPAGIIVLQFALTFLVESFEYWLTKVGMVTGITIIICSIAGLVLGRTGTSFTNVLQGNTSVNTATLSVTGNTYTNVLQGNTSITTPTLNITSNANASSIIVTGTSTLVGKSNTGLVRKKISPENPLDINIATASQFDQLPGIGPVTAQRIITLRKQLGRFQSVDDLKKVTGLGGAKFLEIKALLKV